jgi:SNF2 family DNA or RNA helicase
MLGLSVDSHYEWPCFNITPFSKQKETTEFLVNNPHCFCLNDMGTGKTLAALWAADFLMRQFPRGQVQCIILAPLSTLKEVWAKEIRQHFFGRRNFAIVHGSAEKRVRLLKRDFDFYIMNHDGIKLPTVRMVMATKETIRIVIIDEASAFRNSTSKRSKAVRQFLTPKPFVWAMTGTPTPQSPEDAHGLAKVVRMDYEGTKKAWRDRVTMQVSAQRREAAPGGYQQAAWLLQPAIRIPRKDVIDLPPTMPPVRLHAPFTSQQKRMYDELRKHFRSVVAEGSGHIDAVHEGALRLKLIQIACGVVYDGDRLAHRLDASPRLQLLREAIEAAPGKVLVFAPFTSVLSLLYDALPDLSRAVVNGKVSLAARSKIFKDFQTADHPHGILADAGTMSHGLTLTRAQTTIWYGPVDRTEVYLQANARITRPGQTEPTFSVQISGCKEENRIYDRLQNNESLMGAMLSMMENGKDG